MNFIRNGLSTSPATPYYGVALYVHSTLKLTQTKEILMKTLLAAVTLSLLSAVAFADEKKDAHEGMKKEHQEMMQEHHDAMDKHHDTMKKHKESMKEGHAEKKDAKHKEKAEKHTDADKDKDKETHKSKE